MKKILAVFERKVLRSMCMAQSKKRMNGEFGIIMNCVLGMWTRISLPCEKNSSNPMVADSLPDELDF
jgi:hypothetical protein